MSSSGRAGKDCMQQGNRGRAEWECKWYYNGTTKSGKWLQNGFKMTACYQVIAQPTIGCLYSISVRSREKEGYIWAKTLQLLHRTQEESRPHTYGRRGPQLRQPVKSGQLWSNGLHVKCMCFSWKILSYWCDSNYTTAGLGFVIRS